MNDRDSLIPGLLFTPLQEPVILTIEMNTNAVGNVDLPEESSYSHGCVYLVQAQAVNGCVKVDRITGDWIYTPNRDFTGIDSFELSSINGLKGDRTIPFIIDVREQLPFLISHPVISLSGGAPWNANILQILSNRGIKSAAIACQGSSGTVVLNPLTGGFTYTPDPGFTGPDHFSLSVCDRAMKCYMIHYDVLVEPCQAAIKVVETPLVPSGILTAPSGFQTMRMEEILSLSEDGRGNKQIICVDSNPEIISSYIIDSARGTSYEGQQAAGKKLIVHGYLGLSVEYTTEYVNRGLRAAMFQIPFSTYLVLPGNYDGRGRKNIRVSVDGLFYRMISGREFFLNVYLVIAV